MPKPAPGAKAAALGAELRQIRKAGKLSLEAVTGRLGWSTSKLSRLETGSRNISSEEVAALLVIYDVGGGRRDEILAMARTPDQPDWLQATPVGLTAEAVTLAQHEETATAITDWAPLLVPGLLQTMEYAREVLLSHGLTEEQVAARVMARRRRQDRIRASGIAYTAYLFEPVLRNPVGGRRTWRAQLDHLVASAEDDECYLRVVPGDIGAHAALTSPFVTLDVPGRSPIVHVEISRSGVFLSDPEKVAHFMAILGSLSSLSMDQSESTRLIGDIARQEE